MQVRQVAEQIENCEERIASIIARQLAGDFSETLTRFLYLGRGAESFVRLTQNPNYFGYSRELALIDRIIPAILREGNDIQIIDLGPGNGQKALRILTYLNGRASSYLALDISQEMLDMARAEQNLEIPAEYALCDFNNMERLRAMLAVRSSTSSRLFLLLGNILTNETDILRFLTNLRNIINLTGNDRDYLLIGLELFDQNISRIIREYETEENFDLDFTPLRLLGISRDEGVINITFNEELRRVEEWFIFTRPAMTISPYNISFEEGDRILLSVTYKPTLSEMRETIRNSGWNIEAIELEENQALMLLSS